MHKFRRGADHKLQALVQSVSPGLVAECLFCFAPCYE